MRERPVRIGLIGGGALASAVHLPYLRRSRQAELVAIAEPAPAARRRLERIRGVAVVDDAETLLRRGDLEAVVICAPSGQHAELAVAAAAAGCDFYLEKPIATTRSEALAVVDAASRAGVIAAIGFNRRFHPLHETAREILRSGTIGPVRRASGVFSEPLSAERMPEWRRRRRTGGGVLLELASHHVDLLRWLLDAEVTEVDASVVSNRTEDDTAWLRFRMSSGVGGEAFFSFGAGPADALDFVGERGTIRIDRYGSAVELIEHANGRTRRRRVPPAWAISPWRVRRLLRPGHDPSWARALAGFIGRVRGRECELPGLADGLRSLEVVLAAEESARAGVPVAVAPARA